MPGRFTDNWRLIGIFEASPSQITTKILPRIRIPEPGHLALLPHGHPIAKLLPRASLSRIHPHGIAGMTVRLYKNSSDDGQWERTTAEEAAQIKATYLRLSPAHQPPTEIIPPFGLPENLLEDPIPLPALRDTSLFLSRRNPKTLVSRLIYPSRPAAAARSRPSFL